MTIPPIALAVLDEYDLGAVRSVGAELAGYSNRNLPLTTEGGSFLVRRYRPGQAEGAEREARVLAFLERAAFPAPRTVLRRDGRRVSMFGDEPVAVLQFLQGQTPGVAPGSARQIGAILARLNTLEGGASIDLANSLSIEACRALLARLRRDGFSDSQLVQGFEEETDLLEGPVREDLPAETPRGLVHGDCFPENTLFRGETFHALVDFESACVDVLLFDVGVGINGFCFEEGALQASLLEAFLVGYGSSRVLTPDEHERLPFFIRWGAHAMVLWHLLDLVERPDARQEARVRELMLRGRNLRGWKFPGSA